MIFGKKVERLIDIKKAEEIYKSEKPEPLEKGDVTALIISAVIVFVPVLLIFSGVVLGLTYLFTG